MKKVITKLFPIFIIAMFTSNCVHMQEQTNEDTGEAVFYEVFPSILDTIHYDKRLAIIPFPSEYFKSMDSTLTFKQKYEEWKKTAEYKELSEEVEMYNDSIMQDTTSIYLVTVDSVRTTEEYDIIGLTDYCIDYNLSIDSFIESKPFRIDLSKLRTNHSKVKFIYQSVLPRDVERWRNFEGKYIAGSIYFTKIIFDQSKSFGVLNAGYVAGPLAGSGYLIFIKKNDNGDWVIDKIEDTWIS